MHLALYRKYRPKTFDEVIGQDNIVRTLKNQVINDHISHAYLFTGSRGTGKTSCAKIFARAINCLHPVDGSPCGECEVCKGLAQVNNTDILEMDAASNNRVDEIRDLRESVKYPAIVGKRKVYIIDEVHMLTDSAFNALLKTLEEPPENVVFILCTTEMNKLPATILSRVMKFEFNLVGVEELVKLIKKVMADSHIEIDEESCDIIATAGDGSVRDSLSIADAVVAFCGDKISAEQTRQIVGKSSVEAILPLVSAILSNDVEKIFNLVEQLKSSGKNLLILLKDICTAIKTLILIKSGVTDLSSLHLTKQDYNVMLDLAQKVEKEVLTHAFNEMISIETELKYSLDPQMVLESACIKAGQTEMAQTIVSDTRQDVKDKSTLEVFDQQTADKNWGEVLLAIKEEKYFALASACKNIYKVEHVGESLLLHVQDKSSKDILTDPERTSVLLRIVEQHFQNVTGLQFLYDKENKSADDVVSDLKVIFPHNFKVE